jgi:hypothetical protein
MDLAIVLLGVLQRVLSTAVVRAGSAYGQAKDSGNAAGWGSVQARAGPFA